MWCSLAEWMLYIVRCCVDVCITPPGPVILIGVCSLVLELVHSLTPSNFRFDRWLTLINASPAVCVKMKSVSVVDAHQYPVRAHALRGVVLACGRAVAQRTECCVGAVPQKQRARTLPFSRWISRTAAEQLANILAKPSRERHRLAKEAVARGEAEQRKDDADGTMGHSRRQQNQGTTTTTTSYTANKAASADLFNDAKQVAVDTAGQASAAAGAAATFAAAEVVVALSGGNTTAEEAVDIAVDGAAQAVKTVVGAAVALNFLAAVGKAAATIAAAAAIGPSVKVLSVASAVALTSENETEAFLKDLGDSYQEHYAGTSRRPRRRGRRPRAQRWLEAADEAAEENTLARARAAAAEEEATAAKAAELSAWVDDVYRDLQALERAPLDPGAARAAERSTGRLRQLAADLPPRLEAEAEEILSSVDGAQANALCVVRAAQRQQLDAARSARRAEADALAAAEAVAAAAGEVAASAAPRRRVPRWFGGRKMPQCHPRPRRKMAFPQPSPLAIPRARSRRIARSIRGLSIRHTLRRVGTIMSALKSQTRRLLRGPGTMSAEADTISKDTRHVD